MGELKKGIVVLNEIPKLCEDCPFFQIDSDGIDVMCVIGEGFLDRKKWGKENPKWCPIREVDGLELENILNGE